MTNNLLLPEAPFTNPRVATRRARSAERPAFPGPVQLGALLTSLLLIGCAGPGPASPAAGGRGSDASAKAILMKEFIYQEAPFPSTHASTIVDTPKGLVAAWFGGTAEGNRDVGIWVARREGDRWTPPTEVAQGVEPGDSTRHPCWNPVLFQAPNGPLVLFYKVGPNPREWWGMRITSDDSGISWSSPERLPEGILGPVRNKPVLLRDGTLLCGSSTEHAGWRLHMERTPDAGVHWSRTPPLNDRRDSGLIQPTLLAWPSGRVQILCRSQQGVIYESWMGDSFEIWSKPSPIDLPNPNSGIDGVVLRDGRALLVYNHTRRGRSPLNLAISQDGRTWTPSVVLEDESGEYSYPAVIQSADGRIHITYTWKRQLIRHVVVDSSRL